MVNGYCVYLVINVGITISPPGHDDVMCHVVLLCSTCDLSAKAIVMNFVQFNGFYGCCRCLQEGMLTCIT